MKLGLGLYRRLLDERNFAFARQAGATDLVVHLTDYFRDHNPAISSGDAEGWGSCEGDSPWTEEELRDLVAAAGRHGLRIAALENLSPAFWHDVLLDGPKRDEQIEGLKRLVQAVGRAGIPVIGYNFSLAGVWGWTRGPYARGGAHSVAFDLDAIDPDRPIPDGMVWNMRYRAGRPGETVPPVSHEELWDRLTRFLQEMVPVAEENGVALAAHPDDPPADTLRRTARLVNVPHKYDRLLGIVDSPANRLELCLGSVQEMPEGDIYESVERWARRDRIGYIHFRNVKGRVPRYYEAFADEGDIDMPRIVRILADAGYEGVLIPDHTPDLACDAPWHAGMAYAMGYMRALLQVNGAGR